MLSTLVVEISERIENHRIGFLLFGKRGEVSLEKVDGLLPQACVGIVESDIQANVGFKKQGIEQSVVSTRGVQRGAGCNEFVPGPQVQRIKGNCVVHEIKRLLGSVHLA